MEGKYRETLNTANHLQLQLMRRKAPLPPPEPCPWNPTLGLPHLPATNHHHRLRTLWSDAPQRHILVQMALTSPYLRPFADCICHQFKKLIIANTSA